MPKNNQLLHEEQVSFNDYLNTLIENITVNFKKIKTHEECNQYFSDLSALHIKLGGTKILVQQVLDKIEDNMLSLCKKNNVLMSDSNKNKLSDISENSLDSDLFNSNSDSDINENPLTVIPSQKKPVKNAKLIDKETTGTMSSPTGPIAEVKKTKKKEKNAARKERKATKTLAIVLGNFVNYYFIKNQFNVLIVNDIAKKGNILFIDIHH